VPDLDQVSGVLDPIVQRYYHLLSNRQKEALIIFGESSEDWKAELVLHARSQDLTNSYPIHLRARLQPFKRSVPLEEILEQIPGCIYMRLITMMVVTMLIVCSLWQLE
jgi:hypothetical protein